jgi:hypothetical protein
VSVSAFVSDARSVCCQVSDRLSVERVPGGIPMVIYSHPRFAEGSLVEVTAQVENCIQALSVDNSPVYCQVNLTAQA